MPGRNNPASNTYRFGFNGKEKDDETNQNQGTEYDYGMRIYNPRLGKFLSVDPLTNKYAELTPYQFASNTPIQAIDLDGMERFDVTGNTITIHMTYVAFASRSTGSVPTGLDVVAESKKNWDAMNSQLQSVTYNLDIQYDENGNVTRVAPGSGSSTSQAYKVQFDVKVRVLDNENSDQFQAVVATPEFSGVYLFGTGEFKGATVTNFPPQETAETDPIPAPDPNNPNQNPLAHKEAVFFKNFDFDDETHEDGHTLGLDHGGIASGYGSKVPGNGGLIDNRTGRGLDAPGQEHYDDSGIMKYNGASGTSVPKFTQIVNILNSTDGKKTD